MISTRTYLAIPAAMAAIPAYAAEEGALPQMDPTWFSNQLVWLGVSFLVLYTIVSRVIVPSVGGVLAARNTTIQEAIAKAEAYKATAASAKNDSESRAHEVHEQVNAMIAEAKANATRTTNEAMAKLNADLDAKTTRALTELDRAIADAQSSMHAATAEVAQAMVEKLLGRSVDAAAVKNALKKAA